MKIQYLLLSCLKREIFLVWPLNIQTKYLVLLFLVKIFSESTLGILKATLSWTFIMKCAKIKQDFKPINKLFQKFVLERMS
jgi:hypothetical protein